MTNQFEDGFKAGALWALYVLRQKNVALDEQLDGNVTKGARLLLDGLKARDLTDDQAMQEIVSECLRMVGFDVEKTRGESGHSGKG